MEIESVILQGSFVPCRNQLLQHYNEVSAYTVRVPVCLVGSSRQSP